MEMAEAIAKKVLKTVAQALAPFAPPASVGDSVLHVMKPIIRMTLTWRGVELAFSVDINPGQIETATDPGHLPSLIVCRVCINGTWTDAEDFFGPYAFARITETLQRQFSEEFEP